MNSVYDIEVLFQCAKDLPRGDFLGQSDPYLVVTFADQAKFKTRVIHNTLNPEWDEEVHVTSLPIGSLINIQVFDKDLYTPDDLLGTAQVIFNPLAQQAGTWQERLPVLMKNGRQQGVLHLQVTSQLSQRPGSIRCSGPVRYKRHLCAISGLVANADSNFDRFYTYKLRLFNVQEAFQGSKQHWNTEYSAAQSIFGNSMMAVANKRVILTQHKAMYATDANTAYGHCCGAAQFFDLIKYGRSGGIQRYYTYVIMEDGMRFSETGAAFFSDMMSKHAMHSSASEEVYYAGEFTIEPSTTPGNSCGYKLCIDNNSGTYAPPKERLPMLQHLFLMNFPDMEVEVLDREDPRVKLYHSHCPRR